MGNSPKKKHQVGRKINPFSSSQARSSSHPATLPESASDSGSLSSPIALLTQSNVSVTVASSPPLFPHNTSITTSDSHMTASSTSTILPTHISSSAAQKSPCVSPDSHTSPANRSRTSTATKSERSHAATSPSIEIPNSDTASLMTSQPASGYNNVTAPTAQAPSPPSSLISDWLVVSSPETRSRMFPSGASEDSGEDSNTCMQPAPPNSNESTQSFQSQFQQLPVQSSAASSHSSVAPSPPEESSPVRVFFGSRNRVSAATSTSRSTLMRPASSRVAASIPSIHALDTSPSKFTPPPLSPNRSFRRNDQNAKDTLPETLSPIATTNPSTAAAAATPSEPVGSPWLQVTSSVTVAPLANRHFCTRRTSHASGSPSSHLNTFTMHEPLMHRNSLFNDSRRASSSSSSSFCTDTRSLLVAARRSQHSKARESLIPAVHCAAHACMHLLGRAVYVIMVSGAGALAVLMLLLLTSVIFGRSQDMAALKTAAADAAEGLLHTPHVSTHSMGHVVKVGSAAEVATEGMHAALWSSARLPGHWHDAQHAALLALNSIKGSDLVSVATALQSADLAREALVATSRAAHSTLSHGIPAAKLRPLLVGMQSDLQERVLRWAASVEEAQHAWTVLDNTCMEAEEQFAALATWSAAARRPSAASIAAVAISNLGQHASAQAARLATAGSAAAEYSKAVVTSGATHGMRWISHASELVSSTVSDALHNVQRTTSRLMVQSTQPGSFLQRTGAAKWLQVLRSRDSMHVKRRTADPFGGVSIYMPPQWIGNAKHMHAQLSKFGERRMHALASLQQSLAAGYSTPAASTVFVDRASSSSRHLVAAGARLRMHAEHATNPQQLAITPTHMHDPRQSQSQSDEPHATTPTADGITGTVSVRKTWWFQGATGAGGNRGGKMDTGWFERELEGVRDAKAPWEKLMLAPKVLRAAVDALGGDVAEAQTVLKAARSRDSEMHGGAANGGGGCFAVLEKVEEEEPQGFEEDKQPSHASLEDGHRGASACSLQDLLHLLRPL